MTRFLRISAGVLLLGLLVPAYADEPDPLEIVKKADAATKAVTGLSYKGEVFGEGAAKEQVPQIQGTVKALGSNKTDMPKMNIEGSGAMGDEKFKFHVIYDGTDALILDHNAKTAMKGKPAALMTNMRPAQMLLMQEYFHPTPFSDEIKGDSRKYEGRKSINGAECHVIYIVYSGGQGEARWYFGKDDFLPRRVDRIVPEGAVVTQLSDLTVAPKFEDKTFAVEVPKGFETKEAAPAPADSGGEDSALLTKGSVAPSFSLKTPDGKGVSLDSLRGKVVLVDFWATWCPPCRKAMPGVQKIHERFKDKNVVVYGVSTWERGGDPVKFMKDNGYNYGLLLKGDDIAGAYKVSGIPTFYVIGTDGKILHAASGYSEEGEAELAKVIEDALAKKP